MTQTTRNPEDMAAVKRAGTPATGPVPAAGDQPDMDWLYQVADATGQPVTGPPMSAEEVSAAHFAAGSSRRAILSSLMVMPVAVLEARLHYS